MALAAEMAADPAHVLGQEEVVVLPRGLVVDPEMPAVVGDERAVLGVGDGCCGGLSGDMWRELRCGGGDGGGLEEAAAGELRQGGEVYRVRGYVVRKVSAVEAWP